MGACLYGNKLSGKGYKIDSFDMCTELDGPTNHSLTYIYIPNIIQAEYHEYSATLHGIWGRRK